MKAGEWRRGVEEYGKKLILPPPEDLDTADVVSLRGSEDSAWSVWYRLWTEEEGKSDLSVELTVRSIGGDDMNVTLDDLRVP